jgi:hypothetical protein
VIDGEQVLLKALSNLRSPFEKLVRLSCSAYWPEFADALVRVQL